MANPSKHSGSCNITALRVVSLVLSILLYIYIRHNIYLSTKTGNQFRASCPSCDCDCFEEFNLPSALKNSLSAAANCGENDPYMKEEMEKNMVGILAEEIILHKIVANDTLERSLKLARDSRKSAGHYKKEAEKCSAHTKACETARETADAKLAEERKITAMWKKRARKLGFTDDRHLNKHTAFANMNSTVQL